MPEHDDDPRPRRSPRKAKQTITLTEQRTPVGRRQAIPDLFYDDEETPKASSNSSKLLQSRVPQSQGRADSSPDKDSDASSDWGSIDSGLSYRSHRSTDSKQSTYTILNMKDFDVTDTPVVERSLEDYQPPDAISGLIHDLEYISKGMHFVPVELMGCPRAKEALNKTYPYCVASPDCPHLQALRLKSQRELEVMWDRIEEVQLAAKECQANKYPEVSWNEEVHSRLFRLALTGHWRNSKIWYRNITCARINMAECLLPKVGTKFISPKLVDFALVIDEPDISSPSSLRKRICQRIHRLLSCKSVNQSDSAHVRSTPIAVNVETKLESANREESRVQLTTWCLAQYAKLKRMNPQLKDVDLLPIPLLLIQGHSWDFLIVQMMEDGRVALVEELTVGSTKTKTGTLQVMAVVERLACWSRGVYLPWWEKNILRED